MEPTLPVGTLIFSRDTKNYWKGDVISFKAKDVVVTHRIVEVINKNNVLFYKTKGDANKTPDEKLVSSADVLGETTVFVPYVGKTMFFLKTLPGFMTLIILPTLIFIGFELFKLKGEIEKEVEKKLTKKMQAA